MIVHHDLTPHAALLIAVAAFWAPIWWHMWAYVFNPERD